jgi:hypothetical protein
MPNSKIKTRLSQALTDIWMWGTVVMFFALTFSAGQMACQVLWGGR